MRINPDTNSAWRRDMLTSAARAFAVAVGLFCLLNLAGNLVTPRFDANVWWIDMHTMPGAFANLLLFVGAVALLLFGCVPAFAQRWRYIVALPMLQLIWIAGHNAIMFYRLLMRGEIHSSWPVPLSIFIAGGLLLVLCLLLSPTATPRQFRLRTFCVVLAACPVAFPLLHILFFGATDYRRPADAIVVFGARVYASGMASQALADRVNTACDLYRQGLAPVMIFSGGSGDGVISEPMAMRNLALARGVPASAILMDSVGFNTQATVANVYNLAQVHGYHSVLAVSHAYHLPRVKLAFQRAGLEAYTVPARESRFLVQMPKLVAREIPAVWEYYLSPLAG